MHTFAKDPSKKDNYVVGHYAVRDGKGAIFVTQFRGLSLSTAITVVSSLNGAGHINAELCRTLEKCQP